MNNVYVWFAVDKDGTEWIYSKKPEKHYADDEKWEDDSCIQLPQGFIESFTGRKIIFTDEPIMVF